MPSIWSMPAELPPLAKARVSAGFAAPIFSMARDVGIDLPALRRAAGLPFPEREHSGGVSVEAFLALLEAGARLSDDPLFGLHLGQRVRVADIPFYGLALCACRTFGGALRLVLRFESLVHDLGRSELLVRDGVAHWRLRSPWLDMPGARHLVEFAAASSRAHADFIAQRDLQIIELSSPLPPAPGVSMAEYEKILGRPVRFEAEEAAVKFPAELLDAPIPHADTGFFAALTQWAEGRLMDKKLEAEA